MGLSTSGVALASTNIRLKLAPREAATAYLAASSLASSLAGGIGAVLGGALASFFAVRELSFTLEWVEPGADFVLRTLDFKGLDFLFLLAFLVGLFSIYRLALVRETGEVKEEILRQELFLEIRRDLRSFSTAYGLRRLTNRSNGS
jgi:MFS family permease